MKSVVRVAVELVEGPAVAGKEMDMAALVGVKCDMPQQNEQLPYLVPYLVEMMSQEAGRHFMREFFRLAIEKADLELVLSLRSGKGGEGIVLNGKRPYKFKTSFGTVPTRRIRIRHKRGGRSETPSSRIWGTPRQVYLTQGLKNAVCNLVVKESFSSTLRQLERETGEPKIISKSSVGNILHQEGKRLVDAQSERAKAVLSADAEAKKLLGRAAMHLAEDYFEEVYLNGADLEHMACEEVEQLFYQVAWDPYEEMVKTKGSEQQENAPAHSTQLLESARPEVALLPMPTITPSAV